MNPYQQSMFEYRTALALGKHADALTALGKAIGDRPCEEALPALQAMRQDALRKQSVEKPSGLWRCLSWLGIERQN